MFTLPQHLLLRLAKSILSLHGYFLLCLFIELHITKATRPCYTNLSVLHIRIHSTRDQRLRPTMKLHVPPQLSRFMAVSPLFTPFHPIHRSLFSPNNLDIISSTLLGINVIGRVR